MKNFLLLSVVISSFAINCMQNKPSQKKVQTQQKVQRALFQDPSEQDHASVSTWLLKTLSEFYNKNEFNKLIDEIESSNTTNFSEEIPK